MAKCDIDGKTYRFGIWEHSRGECIKCKERQTCILIEIHTPKQPGIRLCYGCLIEYVLYRKKVAEKGKQAQKKIDEFQKEKKRREKDGLLPQAMADAQGGEPATEKENGQAGAKTGGDKHIPAEKAK